MFKKVLIANRGEIAVRIIRACHELGIEAVVIYSEPDRTSLHVQLAEEAYLVGQAQSSESYLKQDRILKIAKESGVKFHMHQFRHTFAVNFLHNCGQNSFKLQALLGHKSIVSTAIYTRCLPAEIVRADIERLARLENTL